MIVDVGHQIYHHMRTFWDRSLITGGGGREVREGGTKQYWGSKSSFTPTKMGGWQKF